jgi:putative endonuclease
MYYVYVLRNPSGRLYIGSTQNLEERVKRHKAGDVRWTSTHGPWELTYAETFDTRAEVMRREKMLKSGKQNQILRALLNKKNGP